MTASGSSNAAGQSSEYAQRLQGQMADADADRLGRYTRLVYTIDGQPAKTHRILTCLLTQSSKWLTDYVAGLTAAGALEFDIAIPSDFGQGPITVFVDYLYRTNNKAAMDTFIKHSMDACYFAQFLQATDFQRHCDRLLKEGIETGVIKPTATDLQSAINYKLLKTIQTQICGSIVDRMIACEFHYNDDKSNIQSSTQDMISLMVLERAQASKRQTASSLQSVKATGLDTAKDGNSENAATDEGLDGSNKNHTCPFDLQTHDNQEPNMHPRSPIWCYSSPTVTPSASAQKPPQSSGGLFGQSSSSGGGLFGDNHNQDRTHTAGSGLFGQSTQNAGGLFSNDQNRAQTANSSLFGQPSQGAGGLFGSSAQPLTTSAGLFGQQSQSGGGLFGSSTQPQTSGRFGGLSLFDRPAQTSGGLFGSNYNPQSSSGGLFGQPTSSTKEGLFGNNRIQTESRCGLFGNPAPNGWSSINDQNQTHDAGNYPGGRDLFGNIWRPQTHHNTSLFGCSTRVSPFAGNGNNYGYAGSRPGATAGFGNHANSHSGTTCFPTSVNNSTGNGFGSNSGFGFHPTNNITGPSFGQNVTNAPPKPSPFGAPPNTCIHEKKNTHPFSNISGIANNVPFIEKEANGTTCTYQSVFCTGPYSTLSPEELRLLDYDNGRQFGRSTIAWPNQASVHTWGNPLRTAELDLLRVRVNKVEQDTSTMANKVYELEKGRSILTERAEKLEREVKVLTAKVQELEVTKTYAQNGDDMNKSSTADLETTIAKHITVHTATLKRYLDTTTDLIRAEIKGIKQAEQAGSESEVHQKSGPLITKPTELVIREQDTKHKGKEFQAADEELAKSTYTIIYTPTSSTSSSRESSPAEITSTETEDFVAVEASAPTTELDKATHPQSEQAASPRDTTTTSLEEQIWAKVATLSYDARKVFSSLWNTHSADKWFGVYAWDFVKTGTMKFTNYDLAVDELERVGIIHLDTNMQAAGALPFTVPAKRYVWGPKTA